MNTPSRFLARAAVLTSLLLAAASAQTAPKFNGATPLEWSIKLADSEMARTGDKHFFGGSNPRARIDYTTAFFGTSLVKLADRTGR